MRFTLFAALALCLPATAANAAVLIKVLRSSLIVACPKPAFSCFVG